MNELLLLQTLLCAEILGPCWHREYGLTTARRAALTRDQTDGNSLLNPASETALTLHILGMLDGWSQIDALNCLPRDYRGNWNGTFFDNLRGGTTPNYLENRGSKPCRSSWASLAPSLFGRDRLNLDEAILLFEFDVSATEFHPSGQRLRNPSFLALPNESGWTTFDAVLIAPRMRLFLLFEAKLNSDMSVGTTHFPFMTQIVRNLETAYFLTNDPTSAYSGWGYRYVFVAPRRSFDWRLTQYSWVVAHIGEQLETHRRVLEELRNEPHSAVISERLESFPDFHDKSVANVRRLTWEEIIASLRPGGFSPDRYFDSLRVADVPQNTIEAIRLRLGAAGICR